MASNAYHTAFLFASVLKKPSHDGKVLPVVAETQKRVMPSPMLDSLMLVRIELFFQV